MSEPPIAMPSARLRPLSTPTGQPISPISGVRRQLILGTAITFGAALQACSAPGAGISPTSERSAPGYAPQRGQSGKDVMWIPTPDQLVTRMLQLARLTPSDRLVDLGSGDGKIVIAAAREFSAPGLGLEYNGDMVTLSRARAATAGVADRASFRQADIFSTDFSDATVITMYLLPELNLRLRKTLFAMKPGTRIVSHQWTMGHWTPDESTLIGGVPIYLWLIPANAGGEWILEYPVGTTPVASVLSFTQRFQLLAQGQVEIDGMRNTIRTPQLEGDRIRFAFIDGVGVLRRFDGRIDGATMAGTVTGPGETGRPFRARRTGSALPIPGSTGFSDEEAVRSSVELGGS